MSNDSREGMEANLDYDYNCTLLDRVKEGSNTLEEVVEGRWWDPSPGAKVLFCVCLVGLYFIVFFANLGIIVYERIVSDIYRQGGGTGVCLQHHVQHCGDSHSPCQGADWDRVRSDHLQDCQTLGYNDIVFLRYVYLCRFTTIGSLKEQLVLKAIFWINLALGSFAGMTITALFNDHLAFSYCGHSDFVGK